MTMMNNQLRIFHIETQYDEKYQYAYPVDAILIAESIDEAIAMVINEDERDRKMKITVLGIPFNEFEKGVILSQMIAWAG